MRKRALVVVVAALLATACGAARTASVPVPRPFPGAPRPPTAEPPAVAATPPAPVTRPPDSGPRPPDPVLAPEGTVLSTALALQGTPYRNGGSDPSGFDCSGFVQWVYARHGTALPREVRQQWRIGDDVDREDVRAGDLLFFETVSRGASHVGIALDGDRFVHAPSSTGVVRIERISTAYWSSRWVGAKRVSGGDEAALAN